jgi:hypothetical protein
MISPIIAKLAGIMERKSSRWTKIENKWAIGQAGFIPKHSAVDHWQHSIVDHCAMLWHMIEKTWDAKEVELWFSFVDFRKAFDMVPRERPWE